MGPRAGEAFAELMQDAARLHLNWNEFLALFAVSPAQIETMNRAAPGFFYLVSEAWWDAIILYIFRLTDHNKKVLSLVTLKKLLPPAIQGGYDQGSSSPLPRHGLPTTCGMPTSDTATGRSPYE